MSIKDVFRIVLYPVVLLKRYLTNRYIANLIGGGQI